MINNDCKRCRNVATHWCGECVKLSSGLDKTCLFQGVPPWTLPKLKWDIDRQDEGVLAVAENGPVKIRVQAKAPEFNTPNVHAEMQFTYDGDEPFTQSTSQSSFWLCLREAELTAKLTIEQHGG